MKNDSSILVRFIKRVYCEFVGHNHFRFYRAIPFQGGKPVIQYTQCKRCKQLFSDEPTK